MTSPVAVPNAKPDDGALYRALKGRYPFPEWILEGEVELYGRRLDAVAFRLWSGSIGYQICTFEIKVSRSDWLRELENFHKSQQAEACGDAFYIVAPHGLVHVQEELPQSWGLLEWKPNGTLRLRNRPRAVRADETIHRRIAARLLARQAERQQHEQGRANASMRAELRAEIEAGIAASKDQSIAELRDQCERAKRDLAELRGLLTGRPESAHYEHHRAVEIARALVAAQFSTPVLVAEMERTLHRAAEYHRHVQSALETLATPAPPSGGA